MQAYCLKCRAKREMKDARVITYEEWEARGTRCLSLMRD